VFGYQPVFRAGFALEDPTLLPLFFLCSLLSLGPIHGKILLRHSKTFLSDCQ